MDVCLLCVYVVLSCVGRGLCDGLITRPESPTVCLYVWSRNPEKEGQRSILDYKRLWMNEWMNKECDKQKMLQPQVLTNVFHISITLASAQSVFSLNTLTDQMPESIRLIWYQLWR
jgi:endonuclease V-like protein UPF0215 family